MIKLKVDDKEIEVPNHYTLLQAAEVAGAEIPRFCFHERLSIAGNCRMCLVEIKGVAPKPQTSCALKVKDLRPGPKGELPEIFTSSPMVQQARENALEFLLINHPLDCPICDQGGECDLQDQTVAYGCTRSRYVEEKRAVENKYMGPLIKTVMNRCIHCTRCVRFMTEVAGVSELGLTGRGEDAEITPYLERALTSEMQGNLVDLCPVGALTSKPYAFHARPWELIKTSSIDVMDAVGSSIRIDVRGREVMRILPRENDSVNQEWISDKTRYIWDGLKAQRLDRPYIRRGSKLVEATWSEAFSNIQEKLRQTTGKKIGAIAGDLSGVEEMYALKLLLKKLGSDQIECRQDGAEFDLNLGRGSYLFNSKIEGIDVADAILLIGTNPRVEAAILNARIIQRQRKANIPIGLIGERADLRYPYCHIGEGSEDLDLLFDQKHSFYEILKKSKNPMFILGMGALSGKNGKDVLHKTLLLANEIKAIREDWNGFNLLQTAASRAGALDIGFIPKDPIVSAKSLIRNMDVLFLLGADELDLSTKKAFVVYIGSHGDRGAHSADVVLPGSTYTEKSAIYVNTEGRVQLTNRAHFPPGDAKEDWAIIRALSDHLEVPLPFNNISELRQIIFKTFPFLGEFDCLSSNQIFFRNFDSKKFRKLKKEKFRSSIKDFYLTNPIARSSAILAKCFRNNQQKSLVNANNNEI